jgi:hypothetical protein
MCLLIQRRSDRPVRFLASPDSALYIGRAHRSRTLHRPARVAHEGENKRDRPRRLRTATGWDDYRSVLDMLLLEQRWMTNALVWLCG